MEFQNVSKNCLIEWYIRRTIWFLLFAFVMLIFCFIPSNGREEAFAKAFVLVLWGMMTLFFAIYALVFPPLQYRRLKYRITASRIEKHSGLIFLRKQFIPFVRIQHVEIYRGVMDRIFGMSTVIIYTAGSILRIQNLDIMQAENLIVDIRKLLSEVEGKPND